VIDRRAESPAAAAKITKAELPAAAAKDRVAASSLCPCGAAAAHLISYHTAESQGHVKLSYRSLTDHTKAFA